MTNALLVLGVAEAVLFLAAFGVLAGAKEIAPGRKRVGLVLLAAWLIVLVVCMVWAITIKAT